MGVRYQLMAPSIHKIVNYAPEESWILFKSKRSYVQNKVISALFEQLRHLYVRQHNSFVSTPNVECKYAKKFRIRVYNFWKYRLDQGRICGRSCYTRRDHILPSLFKFEFNTPQPTFRGILQISCSIIRLFSSRRCVDYFKVEDGPVEFVSACTVTVTTSGYKQQMTYRCYKIYTA